MDTIIPSVATTSSEFRRVLSGVPKPLPEGARRDSLAHRVGQANLNGSEAADVLYSAYEAWSKRTRSSRTSHPRPIRRHSRNASAPASPDRGQTVTGRPTVPTRATSPGRA